MYNSESQRDDHVSHGDPSEILSRAAIYLPQQGLRVDPVGNILDNHRQAELAQRTQHLQEGYVRDNLVRVYEDKRYAYDGHGRLIQKLSGKHTAQTFAWDEESRLTAVTTTRRPGTEHATTQTTRFDYDAIGRRVAKHDSFGTTVFIWEGMRLIEERRGSAAISYVYEPGSYVPLARLDAEGERTEQGGLGTTQDAQQPGTSKNIAASADQQSAGGQKHQNYSQQPANDALEAEYWQALNPKETAENTGTDGPSATSKLCEVYYFHTDQVGLPEELSNAQGQIIWQAQYKTWGSTVEERWEARRLHGAKVQGQTQGDTPEGDRQEQNLRFQGQYLDRETGLHYNTFRYYDADIGRFISPDPIGLEGGINLGSYSPNPISWIDPWGWACIQNKVTGTARERRVTAKLEGVFGKGNVLREKTLRDSSGKKVTGPDGTGRRVDNVVLGADGKPKYVIEVTSKTADKTAQQLKEASIRNKGGTYIRDSKGVLHDISGIPTRTIRVE